MTSDTPGRGPRSRRGATDTAADIRAATLSLFGEIGVRATSFRAIAARAGVDPALVRYYFGTKQALTRTALDLPYDDRLATHVADQVRVGAGDRLVGDALSTWEDPALRSIMLARLRRALEGGEGADYLQAVFASAPVTCPAAADGALDLRGATVASVLLGLVTARYLCAVEPLASAPPDEIAECWTSVIASILPPADPSAR